MPAHGERGSLPLALMVTIVVTGLVSVVTASVVVGQQQTRFDESYERALQVAEHGADLVLDQLQSADESVQPVQSEDKDPHAHGSLESGGDYQAWYIEEDGMEVVRSEGTVRDVSRTVVIELDGDATSSAGLVGRDGVTLRGNNEVRSFRSGYLDDEGEFIQSPDLALAEDGLPLTGEGIVATNGVLDPHGNTNWQIDGAEIWSHEDGGQCDGTHCDDIDITEHSQELVVEPDPVTLPDDTEDEDGPTCEGSFDGDDKGFERGTVYCYEGDVTFNGDETFDGTPTEPVTIYVGGTLTVEGGGGPNAAHVNFEDDAPRPSGSLRIYVAGNEVNLGQQSKTSAVIHAPRATVGQGGGSNAHFEVYGSMVVEDIATQGGWSLYYDELLEDLEEERIAPRTWREE